MLRKLCNIFIHKWKRNNILLMSLTKTNKPLARYPLLVGTKVFSKLKKAAPTFARTLNDNNYLHTDLSTNVFNQHTLDTHTLITCNTLRCISRLMYCCLQGNDTTICLHARPGGMLAGADLYLYGAINTTDQAAMDTWTDQCTISRGS